MTHLVIIQLQIQYTLPAGIFCVFVVKRNYTLAKYLLLFDNLDYIGEGGDNVAQIKREYEVAQAQREAERKRADVIARLPKNMGPSGPVEQGDYGFEANRAKGWAGGCD